MGWSLGPAYWEPLSLRDNSAAETALRSASASPLAEQFQQEQGQALALESEIVPLVSGEGSSWSARCCRNRNGSFCQVSEVSDMKQTPCKDRLEPEERGDES